MALYVFGNTCLLLNLLYIYIIKVVICTHNIILINIMTFKGTFTQSLAVYAFQQHFRNSFFELNS